MAFVDSCASGVPIDYWGPIWFNGNGIVGLWAYGDVPGSIFAAENVLAEGSPVGALQFFDYETNELLACCDWKTWRPDGRYTTEGEERG